MLGKHCIAISCELQFTCNIYISPIKCAVKDKETRNINKLAPKKMFYSSLFERDVWFLVQAYELALFASLSYTGPPRRMGCLALPPVYRIKIEASRQVHTLPKDTACKLANLFSTLPFSCRAPMNAENTIF